jgi:molybdopterin-binding protein
MNALAGTITDIRTEGNLSLVAMLAGDGELVLYSIVIDTPEQNPSLSPGKNIQILFKETETMIARDWQGGLSVRNRIPCRIDSLEMGVLLCVVKMRWREVPVSSIITAGAAREMNLQAGDEVLALVKTNEVSLGYS